MMLAAVKPIEGSCIYVAQAINFDFKVGVTSSLKMRLGALMSSHGPLRLVAVFHAPGSRLNASKLEKRAHALLDEWRVGGEWFEATSGSVRLIQHWVTRERICSLELPKPVVTADGWLRTGSDRLVPVPLSLQPWSGPESRSKFGPPSERRKPPPSPPDSKAVTR